MKPKTNILNESVAPSKVFTNAHVSLVGLTESFIVNIRSVITLKIPMRNKHERKLVLASFEIFRSKLSGSVTNPDIKQITK
jgi:hypothetical protein